MVKNNLIKNSNLNLRNNLGYLGIDFQYKLIKNFIENHHFFSDINTIVDQNMFSDPNLKQIVGVLKECYEKNDYVPSYEHLDIELRSKSRNDQEIEFMSETLNKIKNTSSEGSDSIRDIADKFFKQQNLAKVANQILDIIKEGDINRYPECEDLVKNALNIGSGEDNGESVLDDLDGTLAPDYRKPIPTGIGKIDELLDGGIGKGELGLIIAPTSRGKTSLTTAISAYAATYKCDSNNYKGFKVVQIFFEDRYKQIKRKHIGRITRIESKDLSKPEYLDTVKETLENFSDRELIKNNLKLKKLQNGEVTVPMIKQFLRKLINSGFVPDLVIIDYFECIAPIRQLKDTWETEGKTMRAIEAMASDLDIAIWVPTQGTKDSINSELVTMSSSGGSVKKTQIAHLVLSIARTDSDMAKNIARVAVLKNRSGQAGEILDNVDFNNGTCIISTDNSIEFDSIIPYNLKEEKSQKELLQSILDKKKVINE